MSSSPTQERDRNALGQTTHRRAWERDIPWPPGVKPDSSSSHHSAIFVVHGMGTQRSSETSRVLRRGIEDALVQFPADDGTARRRCPPAIYEGYWADYDDLRAAFPEEWSRLEVGERKYAQALWHLRSLSALRTFAWFSRQVVRLVFDRSISSAIPFHARLIYAQLLIVAPPVFGVLLLFFPSVMAQVLNDVRIYCAPREPIERAIVERIDARVREAFLRVIGLDDNFCPLPPERKVRQNHRPAEITRVIWVAHSLGSVVSYNVLSQLFKKSKQLARSGTARQKKGVRRFRDSIHRFVTFGSPLDKVAFLFGNEVLQPWVDEHRRGVVSKNSALHADLPGLKQNWWVNFFHVLDPVSGALSHPLIAPRNGTPVNYHPKTLLRIPGLAHVAYWTDSSVMRYLISRFYGPESVPVAAEQKLSAADLTRAAVGGYLIWLGLTLFAAFGFIAIALWIAGIL